MGKKESSSQRRQKRESDRLRRRKTKVERREKAFHLFSGKGDQHLLWSMLLTSPVCHFDTSPLNAEAPLNTVTSNKRRKKKSHKNTWLEGKKRT